MKIDSGIFRLWKHSAHTASEEGDSERHVRMQYENVWSDR